MTVTAPPQAKTDAHYKLADVAAYTEVSYEAKVQLFEQVKSDLRFGDYLYGCYECGICVGTCPSAKFYDFSPRRIAQAAAREDVELIYQQMQEDIWECSQCFSCLRCPRGQQPRWDRHDHPRSSSPQRVGLSQRGPGRLLTDHLQDHVHRYPGLTGHVGAGRLPGLGS